jgi:hypothetical protein
MSLHDLALSKLAAGRAHDLDFVEEALRHGLLGRTQLFLGIELMEERHKSLTSERLQDLLARIDHQS